MTRDLYRQVTLEKREGQKTITQVSFIPDIYSKLHSYVRLRDENGIWSNGWKVIHRAEYATTSPPDTHKGIRGHRKNTGDSLPKAPNEHDCLL